MAGTLTFSEIREEIKSALGNRTDLDPRLLRIINLSQMRIARAYRWEEMEQLLTRSVSISTDPNVDRIIPLPENTRDVYSLVLLDGLQSRKLTRVMHSVVDRKIPAPDFFSRRHPNRYTVWRGTIELFPIPDKTYLLRARAIMWPLHFTGDETQKSELDQKDDLIVALSLSWAFQTLKMQAEADRWWSIYRGMLNASVGEEVEMPDMDFLPHGGVGDTQMSPPYYIDPFQRSTPTGDF